MGPIQSHNPDTIRQIESLVERFAKVDSSPAVEVVVGSSPAAEAVAVDSSPAVEVVVGSSPAAEVVAVDSRPVAEIAVDSSPAVEGFLRLLVGSAEQVVFELGRLGGGEIGFFQRQEKK